MKSILIIISLALVSSISLARVGTEDLTEIRELTKAGDYQKALEKHLWFHEESKSSSGMGGVRLSFALSAWIELAEQYQPAMEALIHVRDADKEKLLLGIGSFRNFHDLSSINKKLDEEQATLELFLILDQQYPEQSGPYYIVAEDLLIKHKKYNICAKYIADPIVKYEGLRNRRERSLGMARENRKMNNSHFLDNTDKNYVEGVTKLIEVLLAIDRQKEAIEVQQRALSYFPSDAIKNSIN